ncbi:type II toxin-antitoxin system prevent-host-death family antitoxin [Methylocystis sp. IM2]|uniref:type II toxin-antitoxin system prevent-host-death family antitoxin n=1 Tax=unclassified Methylocystis TaxID=2625913 RepID=UPI0030F854B8
MRRFTTVELDINVGDVKAVAAREPVIITEHRKDRFVMMSIEDFERLREAGDPQRAFRPRRGTARDRRPVPGRDRPRVGRAR